MIVDLALPRLKAGEGRPEIFLATPADWTLAAECIGMHEVFDEPNARTYEKIVKPICDGCPVKDLCLQAAMEEEGNLSSSSRAGIRGGLRPLDRALIAQEARGYPERPSVCPKRGHPMSGDGEAYWISDRNSWSCAQCKRENRASLAARRTEEKVA